MQLVAEARAFGLASRLHIISLATQPVVCRDLAKRSLVVFLRLLLSEHRPLLPTASKVILDVLRCVFKDTVKGNPDVAVLAQSGDDLPDLFQRLALLLFGGHVILSFHRRADYQSFSMEPSEW